MWSSLFKGALENNYDDDAVLQLSVDQNIIIFPSITPTSRGKPSDALYISIKALEPVNLQVIYTVNVWFKTRMIDSSITLVDVGLDIPVLLNFGINIS